MTALTVLLVDDEPIAVDSLARAIRSEQRAWRVLTASDGWQALKLVSVDHVDVVVSDIHMPGMDGAELTREILVRYPWVIRILLSGIVEPDLLAKATKWSERHLSKPIKSERVVEEILSTVQRRSIDRERKIPGATARSAPVVLVIEDNRDDVELLRQALAEIDSEVELCHVPHARAALSFLDRTDSFSRAPSPHVIVLDLMLPQMSGFEFLSHYRARAGRQVPVIAISGTSKPGTRTEVIRHGAANFVPKPLTWDRYLEVARHLTQYARLCVSADSDPTTPPL